MKQLSIKLRLEKSLQDLPVNGVTKKTIKKKEDNQIIDYNVILNRNVH